MNRPVLTLDIDWAPDWMIQDAAEILARAGVRATFFATHPSPAVEALQGEPLFEIGMHPNFLPGSSQGTGPDEVMAAMRQWFPKARAVRTHSLVQSEPLLALMADRYGVAIDCSIHLPRATGVRPHRIVLADGGAGLIRIPHVFQDNMHMLSGGEWTYPAPWLDGPGLKVMNFHPVHLALNSADGGAYARLKAFGPLSAATRADLPAISDQAPGARRLFKDIVADLAGRETWTISQLADQWLAAGATP